MIYIIYYFIIMNSIGFLSMALDKYKAKRHQWRIPEKTLLFISIIGGSIGSYLGMQVFRHKTKHSLFVIGIPFIFLVQAAVFIYLYSKL